MNFATTIFVLFFLPVLSIGWALRGNPLLYKYFITLASLVFYGYAGAEYVLLLLMVAFMNWGCVCLREREEWHEQNCPHCGKQVKFSIRKGWKRWPLVVTVTLHILLLAFYKYAEPFYVLLNNLISPESVLQQWLAESGIGEIALPAGLSFYSFMGLSYSIDSYRNKQLPTRSFADVLAYISFFPCVMAGPIMRSEQFFGQLGATRAESNHLSEGMCYILSGLFKKVVLATYLSQGLVDPLFTTPENYSTAAIWVGIYAYTMQIYCDFSGYTDIAIGIGRLMGWRIPENFDAPYRSLNLQEFWHRWHITLSRWLRDYLYIPLGGSRRGNRYVNLIATMTIGGLWHGCGGRILNFLIWGFFHGLGLAIVHGYHALRDRYFPQVNQAPRVLKILGKVAAWLLTLHVLALLWVFFRAESYEGACTLLNAAFIPQDGEGFALPIIFCILIVLALQWGGPACYKGFSSIYSKLPWVIQALVAGVLGGAILGLGPEGMLPFIYFDF